ncbi:MAG: S8 family serine peptidase, partial [Ignavibacteria bacterium]|nr:S8 family serine peptidase [Ignavibacteria bacterium]
MNSQGSRTTTHIVNAIIEGSDPSAGGWGYGIQVLNLSLGGYGYDELYRTGLNYVAMMGRVLVASKGNNNTSQFHYPSDYDGSWVISVGATNRSGFRAGPGDPGWGSGGSNYGNSIDVVAPGTMTLSTMPTYSTSQMNLYGLNTSYDSLSGTSMAAPHVSGLATLLISQNPNLHSQDVQGIIRASVDDKGDAGYDNFYGAGRINSGRALKYMQTP